MDPLDLEFKGSFFSKRTLINFLVVNNWTLLKKA